MAVDQQQAAVQEVVSARWVLPMTASVARCGETLDEHAIAISNGRIVALGPRQQVLANHPEATHTALEQHILMPGLINAHGHSAMTLLRGIADDQPLIQWLQETIWPLESAFVDSEFVHHGSELAMAEMLLSGSTCFADMYLFPEVTAALAARVGMRAQIGLPIIESASAWAGSGDEYFAKGAALAAQYRDHPLITTALAPHAPYTVGDRNFSRIADTAESLDCPIHIHLHESATEVAESIAQHGVAPIERLARLGVLSPRTQAVHMTQLEPQHIAMLADSGASAIHCPAANLKLASGYCPAEQLLDAGIAVGLGSDSAASNNSLNIFDAARLAALLAKHQSGRATALPAAQALHMATLGGARALGLEQKIGSLQVGKQADFIAIDSRSPALQPLHAVASQLVYTDAASAVSHVWINGSAVVAERQLLTIDRENLLAESRRWQQRIASR